MPICITCSTPVKNLYTTYSKADDRSLGKGVRLTQCPRCKRFADKYVEHDFVVLFIDLVLIKPQVYRHLLFNRLGRSDSKIDPSILRLGTLLILFDVYLTWARIERGTHTKPSVLDSAPILTQYVFFLTLNVLATFAQHATIRALVKCFVNGGVEGGTSSEMVDGEPGAPRPGSASPAAISTALLVSSCTKLFPILLVIWPTREGEGGGESGNPTASFASRASSYVGWAVLLNNIEALLILLDCGYVMATALAFSGAIARYMVERLVLGAVGLDGDAGLTGPGGVLARLSAWVGVG